VCRQPGVTPSALIASFPAISPSVLESVVEGMVRDRVLEMVTVEGMQPIEPCGLLSEGFVVPAEGGLFPLCGLTSIAK